jgi:hypothetical protein
MKTPAVPAPRVDPKLREARKTNEYVSAAYVVAKLEKKLAAAKKKAKPAAGQ